MGNIIGLVGQAGSGKDTTASLIKDLVGQERVHLMALADPLKVFLMEVFGWTEEQLWGASYLRDVPDPRYPRRTLEKYEGEAIYNETEYLTPRYALQTLGTEWGRNCYQNVWVDYALRDAKEVLEYSDKDLVIITDCRFVNEAKAIREGGGLVWRVVRPNSATTKLASHSSETEQANAEMDRYVNEVILNDGEMGDLRTHLRDLLRKLGYARP
jgi:hypothetical protein